VVHHYGLEAADAESNGRLGGEVVDQPGAVTGTAEGSGSAPDFNERHSLRRVRLSRFVVTDYVAKAIRCGARRGGGRGEPIDGLSAAAGAAPVAIPKEQMRGRRRPGLSTL
jgi:hypothetical protein